MPKVLDFQKEGQSAHLLLEMDSGEQTVLLLHEGVLETYVENYQLMPGDALTMIILDTVDDDVNVPPYLQDGMRDVVEGILVKADTLEWMVNRNESLALLAVNAGTAPELAAAWRADRVFREEASAANEARQMEIAAAEYVDALPASVRAQPRDTDSIQVMNSLGLAIQFVD